MSEQGIASYYAAEFNGRKTANGETYDMYQMTAAHRTLPFNTKVLVTDLSTNKSVTVRINDRGPFAKDRVIDLSLAAAKELGIIGPGTAFVRIDVVELGPNTK
jgi:rare lipoprotein A